MTSYILNNVKTVYSFNNFSFNFFSFSFFSSNFFAFNFFSSNFAASNFAANFAASSWASSLRSGRLSDSAFLFIACSLRYSSLWNSGVSFFLFMGFTCSSSSSIIGFFFPNFEHDFFYQQFWHIKSIFVYKMIATPGRSGYDLLGQYIKCFWTFDLFQNISHISLPFFKVTFATRLLLNLFFWFVISHVLRFLFFGDILEIQVSYFWIFLHTCSF